MINAAQASNSAAPLTSIFILVSFVVIEWWRTLSMVVSLPVRDFSLLWSPP